MYQDRVCYFVAVYLISTYHLCINIDLTGNYYSQNNSILKKKLLPSMLTVKTLRSLILHLVQLYLPTVYPRSPVANHVIDS